MMKSYDHIYESIIDEVNHLLTSLDEQKFENSIQQTKELAKTQLVGLHKNLIADLGSLQKNAEWKTFTIAFYGETNAGKSTLIEILRILLDEASKVIERENYAQTLNDLRLLKTKMEDVSLDNRCLEHENIDKNQIFADSMESIKQAIDEMEDERIANQLKVFVLNERIINTMVSSIIGFIKVLFNKLDIQNEVEILTEEINKQKCHYHEKMDELHNLEVESRDYLLDYNKKIEENNQYIENIKHSISEKEEKLIKFSDGKTIGATNDFTKKMQSYSFKYNDISFNILDLPGIEGKEELVINEIEKSIEKAHVICYVTRRPHAPQSGGTEHEGTIEKIKKQLSTQSEVYLIYNKGIKNPRAIKEELVNPDEIMSLNEADSYMIDAFGENYVRHISLSAYPAYVAIANDYTNQLTKSKDTFFKQFTASELLEKSRISAFCKWIQEDLIRQHERKIVKSNFKKIHAAIDQTNDEVKRLYVEFDDLGNKINLDYSNISKQLQEQGELLKNNIDETIDSEVDLYIRTVRKDTYKIIDTGISNNDLTKSFKNSLESRENRLEISIQNNLNSLYKEFKNEINILTCRYERYLKDLNSDFFNNYHIDVTQSIKIDVKSKGKIMGVLGSIIMMVLGLVINKEQGLLFIILGVIEGILSIGKEIRGFFDSDYKKGQQKKSIDSILDQIREKIRKSMFENIKEVNKKIDKNIKDMDDELKIPVNNIHILKSDFNEGLQHLLALSNVIDREEKSFYENN